jgi:hypothetical protein
MIASKESFEPHSSEQLPNSKRVYVRGALHKDMRVPMREIALSPTKSFNGKVEVNDPMRVYDTSGPWSDPDADVDVIHKLLEGRRRADGMLIWHGQPWGADMTALIALGITQANGSAGLITPSVIHSPAHACSAESIRLGCRRVGVWC